MLHKELDDKWISNHLFFLKRTIGQLSDEYHTYDWQYSTLNRRALAEVDTYWRNMTEELWINEINDMKTMLMQYGNIPAEDITVNTATYRQRRLR